VSGRILKPRPAASTMALAGLVGMRRKFSAGVGFMTARMILAL